MHVPTVSSRIAVMAACALLVTACASTRVAPHSVAVDESSLDEDERALWRESAAYDARLEESGLLYSDPVLQDKIDAVTERLLVGLGAPDFEARVRVLIDPTLNAFSLPNGSIYLHSGLVARMRNEAQLASLIGHELTHSIERHALRRQRSLENRRTVAAATLALLAVSAAGLSGDPNAATTILQLGGDLSNVIIEVQIAGYGRDLERDADRRGITAAAQAGWLASEASALYQILLDEGDPGDDSEPYRYASHPHMEERIEDANALVAELGDVGGTTGEHDFHQVVRNLVVADSSAQLRAGRPDRAVRLLRRHIGFHPDDVQLMVLLAKLIDRTATSESELHEAVDLLEQAASTNPDQPSLVRQLAMLQRAQGDYEAAAHSFKRYLEIAPESLDRAIVEALIRRLEAAPSAEVAP